MQILIINTTITTAAAITDDEDGNDLDVVEVEMEKEEG